MYTSKKEHVEMYMQTTRTRRTNFAAQHFFFSRNYDKQK